MCVRAETVPWSSPPLGMNSKAQRIKKEPLEEGPMAYGFQKTHKLPENVCYKSKVCMFFWR